MNLLFDLNIYILPLTVDILNVYFYRDELIKQIEEIVLKTVKSASSVSSIPSLKLRPRRCQWKDCNFNQRYLNSFT